MNELDLDKVDMAPQITIIADTKSRCGDIGYLTNHFYKTRLVPFKNDTDLFERQTSLYLFAIDLTKKEAIRAAKSHISRIRAADIPFLFVLDEFDRRSIVQTYALGASEYLIRPVAAPKLINTIQGMMNKFVEASWENLRPVQHAALTTSLSIFDKLGKMHSRNVVVTCDEIQESCRLIVEATSVDNIQNWIAHLKQHHNYSYRHSMMVTGFLSSFAHTVGFSGADIQKLALGGLLHDIGKFAIPLSILDKPTALNEEERLVMSHHPSHGIQHIKKTTGNWDPDILDIIVHHHERLDGRGYPDGLCDREISDVVRLVTIADTFSALVDKRAYKESMDPMDAFEIMCKAEGQLERKLVEAFEPIALGMRKVAA